MLRLQLFSFFVALIVPIFFAHSAFGPYFLFGFLTLFNVTVCAFWMQETRGETLENIDDKWQKRRQARKDNPHRWDIRRSMERAKENSHRGEAN
jgi:hypothetical protein